MQSRQFSVSLFRIGVMEDLIATDRQIEQILQQITVAPQQAADGIAVADWAGVIRFVNSSWAIMHGYKTIDQLIGKHISAFHTLC